MKNSNKKRIRPREKKIKYMKQMKALSKKKEQKAVKLRLVSFQIKTKL